MTKAYYWKSQVWGVTYFFIAIYYIHIFQPSMNVPLLRVAAILSLLLYPFAKKAT